jgi:hypothetical protein
MAASQRNPVCQGTNPVDVRDGTTPLCCSPVPGPSRGPETVSDEIGASYLPVRSNSCIDGAEMQVLAALRSQKTSIVEAEQKFRIDRRAIAGAIAWEMLENAPDWKRRFIISITGIRRSAGWGKVHLFNYSISPTVAEEIEAAGYLPKVSSAQRKTILSTPEGAITYVAAIMAAIADLAARNGFEDIRSNPSILTNEYQADTLKKWEEKLRKKAPDTPFVAGNAMALWVRKRLSFLEDAVGTPQLQTSLSDNVSSLTAPRLKGMK